MRSNLPPRVFTAEFWHAHFNYAALRTDPALAAIGSMDGLAGDQTRQWNSVASLLVPWPGRTSVVRFLVLCAMESQEVNMTRQKRQH